MAMPNDLPREFAKLGFSKVFSDWLRSLSTTQTTVTSLPPATDLTALTLRVTQAEADILRALRDARDAQLWDFLPFTRDEVLAIIDNAILTEDGDYLLTEGGDRILLESA